MTREDRMPAPISKQALQRMPYYLQFLKQLKENGVENVAASAIAEHLRLNEVQVRKDLAAVSSTGGKPKSGFLVEELISSMKEFLGYNNSVDAVLVGVGSLGRALLSYRGFESYGLNIVAAFDQSPALVGSKVCGKKILPVEKLGNVCRRMKIHIGIIAVPTQVAQEVCDGLVAGGVLAIWNFAPIHLSTPGEILVHNENMAASLALLSKHLQERL